MAATRSSPLGVYFADFLRPDSFFFFFNLFYPYTVELASVSFGAFLFKRHFHSGDIKIWSWKNVHIIEATPLLRGKGHFFGVLKPGFNPLSEDT